MVMFFVMDIPFSQTMPVWEVKEMVLRMVFKQSPSKQYYFREVGIKEHLVKTFADEVFKQVLKHSRQAFALN